MVQRSSLGDILPAVLGAFFLFALIVIAVRKIFNQSVVVQQLPPEDFTRIELDAMPKCVCGELATEQAPYLRWSRGLFDWLRSVFAAPPRFKRVVDRMQPPTLCKHHARVADAALDKWIFKMRARYSELNADIAAEAAAFEQEGLLRQVGDRKSVV